MKNILLTPILFLFVSISLLAQSVPQGIKYQAVARDSQGEVMANQPVDLQISLLADSPVGKLLYAETHQIQTNEFGLFDLIIGQGNKPSSDFSEIKWGKSQVWISIGMDEGEGYKTIGSTQLLAVPYAFHAGTAGQIDQPAGDEKLTGPFWKTNGNQAVFAPHQFLGTVDFNDLVFKTNNTTRLTISADGNISIDNSLSIGEDLDVGNDATIGNDLEVGNDTDIGGDLDVAGGGTFDNITVKNKVDLNTVGSTTTINGPTTINNSLTNTGQVDLNTSGGTTTIEGATTINDDLTTNGTSDLNGQVTINADFAGAQDDYDSYPLRVEGGDHGVAIRVNGVKPTRNTNWLTLFDGNGDAMGRIEGFQGLTGIARSIINDIVEEQSFGSVENNSTSKNQDPADVPNSIEQYFNNDYAVGALSETLDFVNGIVKFAVNLTACLVGVGIAGDCDDAVWSAVDVVVQGVQLGGYIAYNELNLGASFESGGADYAEWLEKANSTEMINFGEVVGIKGGMISKEFLEAEKFMVVSSAPTIIGAMPDPTKEQEFEKVAFMGQVPVKVMGVVNTGDYILPSGNGDGMAIAVVKEEMRAKDYGRIIGIAWGVSDGKNVFEYVNTAVGINSNDMAGMIENMQAVMNQMQLAMKEMNPDYVPYLYDVNGSLETNPMAYTTAPTLQEMAANHMGISSYTSKEEAMSAIQQYALAQNFDLGEYPYLEELFANPDDPEIVQKTLEHYTAVLERLQSIMQRIQNQG